MLSIAILMKGTGTHLPTGSSRFQPVEAKAAVAPAATVPREEALERLQEAFNVLRQTKQGQGAWN
jgi:hypothetical protein